ncbi:carbohydrate binding domain-containing protein (plasmid) [Catenovulum adriaticum]|uniref:endo-1,4-beta-xylanase n=2 Tax=Catenovulum adriaticum TaxID=2984846 RepID=A0ABY7AT58_9ALTE|nr:carbohydrate binding domain-containing protein [Catenovulum sp. TS8]
MPELEPNDNESETNDPVELINNSGFEANNTAPWFGHGETQVELESAHVYQGLYSAKATARTDNWNGIAHTVTLEAGKTYLMSAYVKLANAELDKASLSVKLTDDAGDHYNSAAYQVEVNNTNWTLLTGEYTHTVDGTDAGTYIYIEGTASGVEYYIDNISVTKKR